jgi:hypothetical protein
VLVPTLTIPVKHNCQYGDVVGECNVCLATVCKVIVPVFFFFKISTLPVLSALICVIHLVSVFYMVMHCP